MPFETVIWLEVHLKLNSPNKLFCQCSNIQEFDELTPNTNICPVCTGQPGALPVLSREPLLKAIHLGLALDCHIAPRSSFDRKSYFYPDLPLGYQITQQEAPTCVDGEVHFYVDKEYSKMEVVRIRDAHIETDTGKSTREGQKVMLDYNRAGTPLVEIVTHPDFTCTEGVVAFLKELQRRAQYNKISDAELENGQMRVDVNISLKPVGETRLGTRVEMKNMNSFSAIVRAIESEVERQAALLDNGGCVDQETRMRDDASKTAVVMRSKEDAMDYRYMPEPDLPELDIHPDMVDDVRRGGVVVVTDMIIRYKEEYNFNKEYINGLITDVSVNKRFEDAVAAGYDPKLVATTLVWPIARELNDKQASVEALQFGYDAFIMFVESQVSGSITGQQAKTVIKEMIQTWDSVQAIIDRHGFKPVTDDEIKAWIEELLTEKPELREQLAAGDMKPLGFITGQVMKKSGGSADAKKVKELVMGR